MKGEYRYSPPDSDFLQRSEHVQLYSPTIGPRQESKL